MSKRGWYAEPCGERWQPVAQVDDGLCVDIDIWFDSKDRCEAFIRDSLVPLGVYGEAPLTDPNTPTPIDDLLVTVDMSLMMAVEEAQSVDSGGSRYCPGCDAPRSRERGVLCPLCVSSLALARSIIAKVLPPP